MTKMRHDASHLVVFPHFCSGMMPPGEACAFSHPGCFKLPPAAILEVGVCNTRPNDSRQVPGYIKGDCFVRGPPEGELEGA